VPRQRPTQPNQTIVSFSTRPSIAGLPDFSCRNLPKWVKRYQMTTKLPNGQNSISNGLKNIPNCHTIYQHFIFQGPPKYVQIVIFGQKICHLATLINRRERSHTAKIIREWLAQNNFINRLIQAFDVCFL
jgi:hypothetical protein